MLGYNRTITRTNINVLIKIGPGAGGGRKRRGKKGNLSNTFDDDCSFALVHDLHICNSPVGCGGRRYSTDVYSGRQGPRSTFSSGGAKEECVKENFFEGPGGGMLVDFYSISLK